MISQKLFRILLFILIASLMANCNNDLSNQTKKESLSQSQIENTENQNTISLVENQEESTPECLSERACEMQEAINKTRIYHGLKPLKFDVTCAISAQEHAQDMYEYNYFSHVDRLGGRAMQRYQKYKRVYRIFENLGRGTEDIPTMIEAWLNSPSHRDNLLSALPTHQGVGVIGEGDQTYWVLCMIQP